jgi:soluble lytic murein transglycosylase
MEGLKPFTASGIYFFNAGIKPGAASKSSGSFRCFVFFIIFFSICFNSCAQTQSRVQNHFYRGLLYKSDSHHQDDAIAYFQKALTCSNVYVRQAAAEQLANMMYAGGEISARTMELVKREAGGFWAAAFDAVGKTPDKEKALAFLLGFEQGAVVPNEARLYTLREFERQGVFFSNTELGAINGHFAILRLRYNEALAFFRSFMEEGVWPEHLPEMFVKYPNLINDLGRAFQFTASGNEGLNLFLRWEENLVSSAAGELSEELNLKRYRLLFFSARTARRRGQNANALALFERARQIAPAGEQSDACIWYILDLSWSAMQNENASADVLIERLEQLVPHWHSERYFDDILEKFLQRLVSERDWQRIVRTFESIRHCGTVSTAAFAWVIARAMQENYISAANVRLITNLSSPEDFLYVSYNAAVRAGTPALYYRLQSANALAALGRQGLPFLELIEETAKKETKSARLQFILGFFNHGAARHAVPYIRAMERVLSPEELRATAQALAQAGMYSQSIRTVSRYINIDNHIHNRRDLELMYPRPYLELTEKHAKENGIPPALMFALVRTESAFQSAVVSRAGAAGLAQLMPETAREMAGRIRRAGGPDYMDGENIDLTNPSLNLHIGAFYLNLLKGRFEDDLLALMAYNGGTTRVRRWRAANTMPADLFLETVVFHETRDYGRKVTAAAAVYDILYY